MEDLLPLPVQEGVVQAGEEGLPVEGEGGLRVLPPQGLLQGVEVAGEVLQALLPQVGGEAPGARRAFLRRFSQT